MKYFAYGVNMNHQQMNERCQGNIFIGPARLNDFRFVYDGESRIRGGGVANILSSIGDVVWGGLFEISESNLKSLDEFEGYPEYYQRKNLMVENTNGEKFEAVAYFRTTKKANFPVDSYRADVLQGAKDCNLPKDYIDKNL